MKTFFSTLWEKLRSNYWFVPTIMAVSATAFSFLTIHLDGVINAKWARTAGWLWAGGPEGARSVLSTIAGSTITVAGVVFSITIVALTLASSQFGPRLLRNFMSDRGTQIVLGVFVSTFLYCLLVLRTVRGIDTVTVIPFLSVTCGILFGVASVGFLIYFIHHVPTSILAGTILGRVATELQSSIDRLYPEKYDADSEAEETPRLPDNFEKEACLIRSKESGFIEAIADEDLVKFAAEEKLVIRMRRRPGDFVADGSALAEVWPADRCDEETAEHYRRSYFFGWHRTPTQDIEYAIDQLVEVAVRALSPGINDPFTAMTCLEWLGAALIQVGGRRIPSRYLYDEAGELRVVADTTDFAGIAASALNQIRQYGASSVGVVVLMLDMLARVAAELPRAEDRETLLGHAERIHHDGMSAAKNESDRHDIAEGFARAQRALTTVPLGANDQRRIFSGSA
ncbi:MAG: DUF2254 domain-containing protein [Chthoniobacterales bacterium]